MYGWMAAELTSSLELRAVGRLELSSEAGARLDAYLEWLALRYVHSRALVVEGGRVLYPMGAFGARRFPNTNPLIGEPDMYPTQYPWGVVASGALGRVDYRAGVVSLPLVNVRYTPPPGLQARPVVGLGISAGPEFRLGVSATRGSYLNSSLAPQLPAGTAWDSYAQTVISTDARYSAGYFEARAEAAWSRYEVPTVATAVTGFGWYGEVRGTISPRLFVAVRYENYDYPFVLPVNRNFWVGVATRQMNGEIGLGYRLSADALVKTSFRKDHWPVQTLGDGTRLPDGYALALQFSLHTDVVALLTGKY